MTDYLYEYSDVYNRSNVVESKAIRSSLTTGLPQLRVCKFGGKQELSRTLNTPERAHWQKTQLQSHQKDVRSCH